MDSGEFQYVPTCSAPRCGRPAKYKIAAVWSSGASSELKNYGLACEEHRVSMLMRGRLHREGLLLADGERIGEVGLYVLGTGSHDRELQRLPDHDRG